MGESPGGSPIAEHRHAKHATMHGMDAQQRDELARLRARAYGRAEPDLDDADLLRLRMLEGAARGVPAADATAASLPPAATFDSLFAVDTAPEETPDETPKAEKSADPTPIPRTNLPADEPSPTGAPRHRRLIAVAWATSLVAMAVLTAVITTSFTSVRPVSPDTGATQVASLTPIAGAEWPQGYVDSDGEQLTYEYLGLSMIRGDQGTGQDEQDCFIAAAIEDIDLEGGGIQGPAYFSCAASDFPANVQFVVSEEAPAEMRAEYPDGTGIQLIADDDGIGVFVSPITP